MRSSGWRHWFPLAIVFGMTAIVAGWITRWYRQSRVARSLPPHPNEPTPPAAIQMESSAAPIDIAAPVEGPPAPTLSNTQSNDATNRTLERAHLSAWFISIALILNLASRILETGHEVEFANLTTWLTVASFLLLLGGIAALVVIWRRIFVWPRWLWRFSGLGVAALISLSATQVSFRSSDLAVTWYQTIPLWIIAVGSALVVTWPRREAPIAVEGTPRWEAIALLSILVFAFLLRVVDLRGLPYVLMGDES
jgi:hypothetical protein